MKKGITISERGNKVIYRLGRRIVCYRVGYRVYFGKPSDATHDTFDALSENIAHERCIHSCLQGFWFLLHDEKPHHVPWSKIHEERTKDVRGQFSERA